MFGYYCAKSWIGNAFFQIGKCSRETRKVFSGKYFETIPRDLVSAATAAASDLATQYSTISPPLNAFNITGLFLQTSAFSQKMFSLFLFFSLGMSFGVKSVSHDERREILMLILANTGFKNTHTHRSGDDMTLHETRDCVIFSQRWNLSLFARCVNFSRKQHIWWHNQHKKLSLLIYLCFFSLNKFMSNQVMPNLLISINLRS